MIFGMAAQKLMKNSLPMQPEIRVNKADLLGSLNVSLEYIETPLDVQRASSVLLNVEDCLGLDIETCPLSSFKNDLSAGLVPRKSSIRLVQVFDGRGIVFVFDLHKIGSIRSLPTAIWDRPCIAHNALFEMKHLLYQGVFPKKLGCTLLADRIIHGNRKELKEELGLSKSATLKDLSKELLSLEISKELQTSDWSQQTLTEEQIEYAALDAVLVVRIFRKQRDMLKKNNLERSYRLLRDAQVAVARMELCGIGFDVEKHRELIKMWIFEKEVLEKDIIETIGKELNLNSTKQIGEWLNEALSQKELEKWSKTGKGNLSTSTHAFKLHEHMHDVFPKIVEYKHLAKRISSFGEGMYKYIDEPDHRLYGSFSLGTTTTGRMSSSHPNMQNMPREGFRELFCAKDGFTLIGLDYSQQELRVAALVAQDEALLKIYENGEDAHVNTAAMVLKLPKEKIQKEHRQLAKALNFGLLYGQGAKGLAVYAKRSYGVDMSEAEAEVHRTAFFKVYKGLRTWQRETGNRVQFLSKVTTQCGRIRDFSKEISFSQGKPKSIYTAALNLPIQGAAAEVTLHALIRISNFLCEECRLVNVVHDEILLEVQEGKVQEYAALATQAMELAFLDVFPNAGPYIKGLVEAKYGKTWAEAK